MTVENYDDARTLPHGTAVATDLCIVGGGAAGITLAREFAATGLRVTLLEAGGLSIDPGIDAAADIENVGRDYHPNSLRLRYFGGTTNHWGGACVPYEPADFEAREWIGAPAWPFGYDTLDPYYRRAHEVLMLGEYDYDPVRAAKTLGTKLMPFDGSRVATQLSRYNRVRLSFDYGDELERTPNIRVILYADVSDIRLAAPEADKVTHVTVNTPAGNAFEVRARWFVLAAGGIENARLLLAANGQRPAGVGNENDLVGRFFQEHLWFASGLLVPLDPGDLFPLYLREVPYGDIAVRCHLVLTAGEAATQEIGRFRTELATMPLRARQLSTLRQGAVRAEDVFGLAANPYGTGHAIRCRGRAPHDAYVFNNYIEQVPNPDSRVTLRPERDAYGRLQPRLDWRISRADHDCIAAAHRVIAEEAGRLGFGRMRLELDPEPGTYLEGVSGGGHHMGTTRMSDDPRHGVTDGQGRVHTTRNLYVAGSSLFPTGGYPNPTLTIVAMALRLSDHLEAEASKDDLI